jgi:hypothetical protein
MHGLSQREDNILLRDHSRIAQKKHGESEMEERQRADDGVCRDDGHFYRYKKRTGRCEEKGNEVAVDSFADAVIRVYVGAEESWNSAIAAKPPSIIGIVSD